MGKGPGGAGGKPSHSMPKEANVCYSHTVTDVHYDLPTPSFSSFLLPFFCEHSPSLLHKTNFTWTGWVSPAPHCGRAPHAARQSQGTLAVAIASEMN